MVWTYNIKYYYSLFTLLWRKNLEIYLWQKTLRQDTGYFQGLNPYLKGVISKYSDILWRKLVYIFRAVVHLLPSKYFVLAVRGGLSEFLWVWSGRDIKFFYNFGWVLPVRGVDLCLYDDFLYNYFGLRMKMFILRLFFNSYQAEA